MDQNENIASFTLEVINGKSIYKRQTQQQGPNDFVTSVMQLFNVTADGGPLQMMSSFFMQFLNTTASFVAPFLGMSSGGDPTSLFNSITQQFLSMFGQVSGLWSNTVNNQMNQWRKSISPVDEPEYEVIDRLVGKMQQAQGHLENISSVGNQTNSTSHVTLDQSTIKRANEARKLIKEVWMCLKSVGYDPYSQYGHEPIGEIDLPPSNNNHHRTMPNVIQLQEDMLYLWPLLSRHISDESLNHGKSGHRCLEHCFDLASEPRTSTEETAVESDLTTKKSSVPSESSTTNSGEIEFEESNGSNSRRKVKFDP